MGRLTGRYALPWMVGVGLQVKGRVAGQAGGQAARSRVPAGEARWGQGDGGGGAVAGMARRKALAHGGTGDTAGDREMAKEGCQRGRRGGDRATGGEARWREARVTGGGGEVAGMARRKALARRGTGDTAERRR